MFLAILFILSGTEGVERTSVLEFKSKKDCVKYINFFIKSKETDVRYNGFCVKKEE